MLRRSISITFNACFFAAASLLCVASANGSSEKWLCPGEFDNASGPIIERYAERVYSGVSSVWGASDFYPNRVALFVFPAKYESVRERLRSLMKDRFGEETYEERYDTNAVTVWLNQLKKRGWPESELRSEKSLAEWKRSEMLQELGAWGYRFDKFRMATIMTKPYNLIEWRDGYSMSTVHIIDGRDILRKDVAFVVLTRLDKAKEFGIPSAHVPIPGFWNMSHRYVTNTEYSVMRRLGNAMNVSFGLFRLYFDAFFVRRNMSSWIAAKAWIERWEIDPTRVPVPPEVTGCK